MLLRFPPPTPFLSGAGNTLSLPCAGCPPQVFPLLSTWVRSWRGVPKRVVDAFEPLNRLLVGKAVHVSAADKLHFDFFWLWVT